MKLRQLASERVFFRVIVSTSLTHAADAWNSFLFILDWYKWGPNDVHDEARLTTLLCYWENSQTVK